MDILLLDFHALISFPFSKGTVISVMDICSIHLTISNTESQRSVKGKYVTYLRTVRKKEVIFQKFIGNMDLLF